MKCFGIDIFRGAQVLASGENVIECVEDLIEARPGAPLLAAGFIDLQVNGYAGVDYNNPSVSHDEIVRSIRAQYACGVTRLLPTVITGSPDDMAGALENLAAAKESLDQDGQAIEGFHVEGPHISADDGPRGAHPRRWVRRPDLDEYRRWQDAAGGNVRLVTLSPEWPEATDYIEALVRDGVVVAIGHTAASKQQIEDAAAAGATLCTHLGNGSHAVLPRHPNYIWDQLAEDRLAADFIVDGIHLPASFLKAAIRAKGVERSILVTDASSPAGGAPGRYWLGEQEVDLTADDRVVLAGKSKLAGSALKMHNGVSNLMRLAGLSLQEAVTMATRNPARVGRIASRQRGLAAGDRADVVEFSVDENTHSIRILKTWMGGRLVYSADTSAGTEQPAN